MRNYGEQARTQYERFLQRIINGWTTVTEYRMENGEENVCKVFLSDYWQPRMCYVRNGSLTVWSRRPYLAYVAGLGFSLPR